MEAPVVMKFNHLQKKGKISASGGHFAFLSFCNV
jgi:hypothetical protein